LGLMLLAEGPKPRKGVDKLDAKVGRKWPTPTGTRNWRRLRGGG